MVPTKAAEGASPSHQGLQDLLVWPMGAWRGPYSAESEGAFS